MDKQDTEAEKTLQEDKSQKKTASSSEKSDNRPMKTGTTLQDKTGEKKTGSSTTGTQDNQETQKKQSRPGVKTFWMGFVLALIVVLAGAVLGGWAVWRGPLQSYAGGRDFETPLKTLEKSLAVQDDTLKKIQARLETQEAASRTMQDLKATPDPEELKALSERLDALEQALAEGGDVAPQALSASMAVLARRVAVLEKKDATGGDLTALTQRFTRLEDSAQQNLTQTKARLKDFAFRIQQFSSHDARLAELARGASLARRLAALMALREAMRSGEPFSLALNRFAKILPEADISTLKPYAVQGVAQPVFLTYTFPEQALREAAGREAQAGKTGLLDKSLGFIKGFVKLHPRDGAGADTPENLITRTRLALEGGDVRGALIFMKALPADVLQAGAAWLDRAQAYEISEDALRTLSQSLDRLSTQPGGIQP